MFFTQRIASLLPAVLTVFPCPQIDLTGFRSPADVCGCCLVLNGPPEECSAAEASHGTVVDVFGRRLVADLEVGQSDGAGHLHT